MDINGLFMDINGLKWTVHKVHELSIYVHVPLRLSGKGLWESGSIVYAGALSFSLSS